MLMFWPVFKKKLDRGCRESSKNITVALSGLLLSEKIEEMCLLGKPSRFNDDGRADQRAEEVWPYSFKAN